MARARTRVFLNSRISGIAEKDSYHDQLDAAVTSTDAPKFHAERHVAKRSVVRSPRTSQCRTWLLSCALFYLVHSSGSVKESIDSFNSQTSLTLAREVESSIFGTTATMTRLAVNRADLRDSFDNFATERFLKTGLQQVVSCKLQYRESFPACLFVRLF